MATWPATLPAAKADGYALAPVDPCLRTDMEVGAPRTRRHTAARNDRVNVGWVMTDAQFVSFRAWFESATQAAGGAVWFSIPLAIGAGGVQTVEARFTAIWQAGRVAKDIWSVTATLEVR